ncbi:uncharacterized protein ACNLHF_005716 [Anomaloglossus baeobatrachus]|uniref:uncharacterized protein LOC142287759 n=1 Tax=Anomaloglossus baeobatrachus TaxID=238106 RepID=UPI003F50C289
MRGNESQSHMSNSQKMKDRSHITKIILNLTLEIIYMLTGEDYSVVKKTSRECVTPWSRHIVAGECDSTRSTTMAPSNQTLIDKRGNDQKILALANKIIELVTGEVPIRCQDVTVYFSVEEWEYLEEHKDLYNDIMMEKPQLFSSLDSFAKNDLPETCLSSQYCPAKHRYVPPEAAGPLYDESHSDKSAHQIRPVDEKADSKCSMTRMYNKGDRGHPCRVPLWMEKGLDRVPLILRCAVGEWYKAIILDENTGPKPMCSSV